MPRVMKIIACGDRSCSMRAVETVALPLKVRKDCFIPSMVGFSRVISVQMAAIPIVPAPIKRTLFFHRLMAKDVISIPSGIGVVAVNHGTAPPQAKAMPMRMAIPPVRPTR